MRTLTTVLLLFVLAPVCLAQEAAPAADSPADFGLLNARFPMEEVLFGGQPDGGQLDAMARSGYKTVIDLRREIENRGFDEPAAVERLGLEYVAIPVGSETLQDTEIFETFLEVFEAAERPVLVHCASGNRVGALYYAWLVAREGMSREEALAEAQRQGLRSQALADAVDVYLDSLEP